MGGFNMFIKNIRQIKRLLMVVFLVCFFVLCSCNDTKEPPIQETYSITYVINGHGTQPENLTEQTHLPNPLPALTEKDWKFENWYYDNGTFEKPAVGGTEITEDTTLYAKWTEDKQTPPEPIKTYSITFVKNGHGRNDVENLTNQTHLPNNMQNLIDEGWAFMGWYYDNGAFEKPAVGGTKLTEDTILYAKWTEIPPSYFVRYEILNEEVGTIIGEKFQIVTRGEDTTPVTVIPNIGYKFIGWNKSGLNTDKTERVDELTRKDTNVQKDITAMAVFQGPITYIMDFKAEKGGKVEGALKQEVLYGDKGEVVTAIPDEGYRFVRWSDGETEAVRTNECVTYQGYTWQIYAEFERYKRDFKLDYKEATSNTEVKEYTFFLDDMDKEQYLPVPKRDGYAFMGWYSDWFHTIQVTDETGKTIVGKDWFNEDNYFEPATNPDMKLFAKWKPIKEVPIYKILLVYVTEIHATLESNHGGMKKVDFVMTDLERQICELTSKRTEEYLEAILNGTVDFQVDSYFTKEPLTEDNFFQGSSLTLGGGGPYYDYGINPEIGQLPEVNDKLDKYGSILICFSLNDDDASFHVTAGSAGKKWGNIHLESIIGYENLEYDLDLTYPGIYRGWIEHIGLYIHELTHTIELQLRNEDFYGMHEAAQYYSEHKGVGHTEFDFLYDYLRNEFSVGDRNVGIPYEFWTGEYFKA